MKQQEFAQKTVDEKLNLIFKSAEKTRKYFFWTLVITVVLFVLPLIGLIFVIPFFLNTYIGGLSNLGM